MDSHDVGRDRPEDYYDTLNSVQQPVLVLGIRSDVLYPLNEQEELHQYLGNSEFHVIESDEGHDGFLLAQEEVCNPVCCDLVAFKTRCVVATVISFRPRSFHA